tara:strand:+ start:58 stop:351 length:294 start_codon:yes stop_codon:yes gene_type:complete
MKENIELNISIVETIEIDETQFLKIVEMIKKIGTEKFMSDNSLSGDTAEVLAHEYCQDNIEGKLMDSVWFMDEEYIDNEIIDNIIYNYTEELDENIN